MDKSTAKKEPAHISSILDKILSQCREKTKDGDLTNIWKLWEGLFDEETVKNAKPQAFKGSLVLVNVSNSAWCYDLQFRKDEIIDRLNKSLGRDAVKEIKFKVGPI